MNKLWQLLLSLNSLRKAIGFGKFVAAVKFNFHIEEISDLPFKKALVLAPHPDDEVFGVGGTIKKLTKAGCDVQVVYFCDGSAGVKENGPIKNDEKLVEIRRKEAEKSSEILGVKNRVFFGFADGKLQPDRQSIHLLTGLIKDFQPDIIFVPSFLDNHPDHRAVNEILLNCPLTVFGQDAQIWAYQVWTPIWSNRLIAINDEMEAKKQAMRVHLSQLEARNYDKAILGLNEYQAEINNILGFAEGFFASSLEIYLELYKKSK